jgi:hypothetical protein
VKIVRKKAFKKLKNEENEENINESEYKNLDIVNSNFQLKESARTFKDGLKIHNETYNYKGIERSKEEEELSDKSKYKENETEMESNDKIAYEAEYPKIVDWNEYTFPMSGRPFTIEKKPRSTLSSNHAEKLSIKESYKPKDWNKMIKVRKDININMPKRNIRKPPPLLRQRVPPVILKGNETDWNKVNKLENDYKLEIDRSVKKTNFVLSKENEVHIENEAEEILINDDYNIVEENYSRPIRANIRKVPDYTEESVSSEYDILNKIKKHEGQFNQFKELVYESIKLNGQKIIINDISGKYPRRVETFEGLDENYQKFVNDIKNN